MKPNIQLYVPLKKTQNDPSYNSKEELNKSIILLC